MVNGEEQTNRVVEPGKRERREDSCTLPSALSSLGPDLGRELRDPTICVF